MKRFIFPLLFFLFSCDDKKEKEITIQVIDKEKTTKIADSPKTALQNWLTYYRTDNQAFEEEKFILSATGAISFSPSNVTVMNEKGFNEIYKPFLVFNESKTKYLDFDSYQWSIAPDGSAGYEADQEVALVDYQNKTAQRIAFFGPSYSIEEAYWIGDSVAVLLGNSYEKVPFIMKYHFGKKTVETFQYPDTLKFDIPYAKVRMRKFGIKTE